ncbi:MAG: ABC transporter ATP-binding protein [Methanobacteriota archaeon]|nr:MAG: ABC transporter ATP-binding protein [Euryarchaeota archaeon]
MKNSPHISLREVTKSYDLGESKVIALDAINLEIEKGEFVVVMGPSGSGKSTLVNMIGGIDKPNSGNISVEIEGQILSLENLSSKALTNYRRYRVGFVFQFYSLVPTLTALENVEMIGELINLPKKKLKERSKALLDEVGLEGRYGSFPSQLSGGERQRVALARALVKNPEILIVDEPTGQLDEQTGHKMVQLIRETAKRYGSTVIMVTHDVNLKQYGDRVLYLSSGKIVKEEGLLEVAGETR